MEDGTAEDANAMTRDAIDGRILLAFGVPASTMWRGMQGRLRRINAL
jgi:hypothetical protein